MNKLQKYIFTSYASSFLLAMLVLTFVLSIGTLVKATQYVIKGLDPGLIGSYILVSIPEFFSFTIPLSVLVSSLLVFGRLSTDGEISAMRACGINIWNVMTPLVGFGILLTAISICVNSYISPEGYYKRHLIQSSIQGTSALTLLEPGHYIEEYPGMTFWFESKEGDVLSNILIYDRTKPGFTREIRAESAIVTNKGANIEFTMSGVRIEPFSRSQPGAATVGRAIHTITNAVSKKIYIPKVGGLLNSEIETGISDLNGKINALDLFLSERTRKAASLLIDEINKVPEENGYALWSGSFFNDVLNANISNAVVNVYAANEYMLSATNATSERIAHVENAQNKRLEMISELHQNLSKQKSELNTELNRRFALGITPIVFLLIGVPLGMKTSRKESNAGVAISIGVMILYYTLMILTKGQAKNPAIYPHLIIWFAPAACIIAAIILIRRNR